MSLVPDELILNLDWLKFEALYHWQNPDDIRRLGVLSDIHNWASVQPMIKCLQALAPSIKLPMNAMRGFGLPT